MEKETQKVVDQFVKTWTAFTSLDVSNKVKETLPNVRHREVANIVRDIFSKGVLDYMASTIDVWTDKGIMVEAQLYHSVYDEDNLDIVYPMSQRKLVATPPKMDNNFVSLDPTSLEEMILHTLKVNEGIYTHDLRVKIMNESGISPVDSQKVIMDLLDSGNVVPDDHGKLHVFQKLTEPSIDIEQTIKDVINKLSSLLKK